MPVRHFPSRPNLDLDRKAAPRFMSFSLDQSGSIPAGVTKDEAPGAKTVPGAFSLAPSAVFTEAQLLFEGALVGSRRRASPGSDGRSDTDLREDRQ